MITHQGRHSIFSHLHQRYQHGQFCSLSCLINENTSKILALQDWMVCTGTGATNHLSFLQNSTLVCEMALVVIVIGRLGILQVLLPQSCTNENEAEHPPRTYMYRKFYALIQFVLFSKMKKSVLDHLQQIVLLEVKTCGFRATNADDLQSCFHAARCEIVHLKQKNTKNLRISW